MFARKFIEHVDTHADQLCEEFMQKIDPKLEPRRRKELAALRKKRGSVEKYLTTLDKAARGTDNLMPFIVDCVRHYVTVGEICKVLRGVFGEHRSSHSI